MLKFKNLPGKINTHKVFLSALPVKEKKLFNRLFVKLFFSDSKNVINKYLFNSPIRTLYREIKNSSLNTKFLLMNTRIEKQFMTQFNFNNDTYIITLVIPKENLYYLLTLFLGVVFLLCQGIEYVETPFHINDSVYGSAFYMLTGLHGLHVIVGVLFLSVYFIRKHYYMSSNLLGLEFAAWYWHFVDVVWIFLYFVIYIGSYISSTLF